MNLPTDDIASNPTSKQAPRLLYLFLTIIAGAIVTVIIWTIVQRLIHVIILLVASFFLAYLLSPLVDRLKRRGAPRGIATSIVYVVIIGGLVMLGAILLAPLEVQLRGIQVTALKNISISGTSSTIKSFLAQHNIVLPIDTSNFTTQVRNSVTSASETVLGSTLAIAAGTVSVVTDLLLVLVIAFYLLLDGASIHNRGVRVLPPRQRERWFFFEAVFNTVVGGYIRGQLLVALTVGSAAGVGCALLGVKFPIVIGVLAFVAELVPMIGPVLGMIPAVALSLFQPFPLPIFVVIYFIVLQQVESNFIVPRISGHAVGLHPLAALLALILGFDLGGIGAALLAVPLAGIAWVMAMAIYGDATGQTNTLSGESAPATPVSRPARAKWGRRSSDKRRAQQALLDPLPVHNSRLVAIQKEQQSLMERFHETENRPFRPEANPSDEPAVHVDQGASLS